MLHLTDNSQVYLKKYVWLWLVASFEAGFINSAGLLITGQFVSHITGYGTMAGVSVGHSEFLFGIELLVIPIAFIGGGVLTSLILDRERPDGKVPPYHLVQGLITIILALVLVLGDLDGLRGKMPYNSDGKYGILETTILGLLVLSCGLKNSLMAWSTWGRVRVTHITGLSTDIGLNLLRTIIPGWKSTRFEEEKHVNIIRILIMVSFSSGAMISAMLFPKIGDHIFLVGMAISLSLTIFAFVARLELHQRLKKISMKRAKREASTRDRSGDNELEASMS